MAIKKKKEIFFVRETPANYVIDYDQLESVSKKEFERRLKASKKTGRSKKAA